MPVPRLKMKNLFFDRKAVQSATDRATNRNLSKFGAYVRRVARSSIRKVGKKGNPSKPGKPPKSRTGTLKKFLFFFFNRSNQSVIIGPEKTNQVFFKGNGEPAQGTVPEALETGGEIQVLESYNELSGKWYRADLRSKRRLAEKRLRLRKVKIEARPFMGPANEKVKQQIPEIWANSMK